MTSILDPILIKQGDSRKSANWYRSNVLSMGSGITASKLMASGKLTGRPNVGLLNMFFYDPKFKKTLPLYDRFPLVLPLENMPGGFVGLNFHYLRPGVRFTLLEQLQSYATNNKMDKTTRLDVSWNRVKNIPILRPAVKKYLYSHVRSNFLKIDLTEAAIAVFLPVAQFKKGQPY
jgi:hypothetical protein